ncbi:MAG: ATP-binding cassette domain-containing protein [Gammaproteobacteria bacterium]|nr:ATP-binding cassette domain-containing protein [Gammaproteobacteria bacterium]
MLSFRNVNLRRGPHLLFENATFTLAAGWKVGVTGANGSGKSSLFQLLLGTLHADAGEVEVPAGAVIAHVAQEMPASDRSALDFIMDGDGELRRLEQGLAAAEAVDDGHGIAVAHDRLAAVHGYDAAHRAARLLHGLGFGDDDHDRPVGEFSGGWRMRLNLGQALMCRSDMLLLDEPTNHLDLDAVIWLERWLRVYPGTLLLISHDRDFLDALVDHVVNIEQGAVRLYTGDYSQFEHQRAARLAGQQSAYEKQQREMAHMHRFVERFRAKATKARQAQSRLKALARMETIAPAHVDDPFSFSFRAPEHLPRPLLVARDVAVGYDGVPLLAGMDFQLSSGDKVALVGANGAGKSTLVRFIAGDLKALTGECERSPRLNIGYFTQHAMERLRDDQSPAWHLAELEPGLSDQEVRNYLGGFGFAGERVFEPVAGFSGGERARLILALIIIGRPNLLLLDEPTNHLDLDMRHALNVALQEFEGCVVLVSHDRHLLRTMADELWWVKDGRVAPFQGDLDDYQRAVLAGDGATTSEPAVEEASQGKDRRRRKAAQRDRLRPLRDTLTRAEARVSRLSGELTELEAVLGDGGLYEPERKDELKRLLAEQGRLRGALAEAEEQWLAAGEALEGAEVHDDP